MSNNLLGQIEELAKQDRFEDIIALIDLIPEDEWEWDLLGCYIRALNNTDQLERAVTMSLRYQEQGEKDALWNYRLGYAYLYLDRDSESEAVLLRGKELAIAQGNGEWVGWIDELLEVIEKEKVKKRRAKAMNAFVPNGVKWD